MAGRAFVQPSTEPGLHNLYKASTQPLKILEMTRELLEASSSPQALVNETDHKGDTPLGLLILHINRGLRYHSHKIPELKRLEDNYAQAAVIDALVLELDEKYQQGVYETLHLLLSYGANCNHIGGTCPGIVNDTEWCDGFETKIMQSEQRWNLLGLGASMKYSKYTTFDSLTNFKVWQTSITFLHLAAWRGDVRCLELLVNHGAHINARSVDGRNALHFLYHYCTKPCDLAAATRLLLLHGIDVHATDSRGNTPLVLLLYHIFSKRSHVRYLATQLLAQYRDIASPHDDHYQEDIMDTLRLLIQAGAPLNQVNKDSETPLHIIFKRFKRCLENCEEEFQELGHQITPYHFRVKSMAVFAKFLIEQGSQAEAPDLYGNTALHNLSTCIKGLSLSAELNPTADLLECFSVLLQAGINPNSQGFLLKTGLHLLLETLVYRRSSSQQASVAFERYKPVLELLLRHGCDVNIADQIGNAALSLLFGKTSCPKQNLPLLLFLLRAGADPNCRNRDNKLPLQLHLKQHVLHHDPALHGRVTSNLTHYLEVMSAICATMSRRQLEAVFDVYRESGFYGVICEAECQVYRLLERHCRQPRGLSHCCRLVVWAAMGRRFYEDCQNLPLPAQIRAFLYNLVT